MKKYGLFLTVAVFLAAAGLASDEAMNIIRNVQQSVPTDTPLRVKFQQVFEWKITGKIERIDGQMILSGLSEFRIETPDQTIVSNGNIMWTYSRPENQVIIDSVRNTDQSLMPRDVLFAYPEEYNSSVWKRDGVVSGTEAIALRMIPKDGDQFLQEIKVWVNKQNWQPLRIQMTDLNENETIYDIVNIRADSTISPAVFQFTPDEEMEVIDVRQ